QAALRRRRVPGVSRRAWTRRRAVGPGPEGQSRSADRSDGPDPARALQEWRAARGRLSDACDRARRHADALVCRLARAWPGVGPRVLRSIAVPWRSSGRGGGTLSSRNSRTEAVDVATGLSMCMASVVVGLRLRGSAV